MPTILRGKNSCFGDKIHREILVESGYAVVFTNALNHAGGANLMPLVDGDHPYVYRLFAYVVSNPVDYPPGEGGTQTCVRNGRDSGNSGRQECT